jgi:hypothetical protein
MHAHVFRVKEPKVKGRRDYYLPTLREIKHLRSLEMITLDSRTSTISTPVTATMSFPKCTVRWEGLGLRPSTKTRSV